MKLWVYSVVLSALLGSACRRNAASPASPTGGNVEPPAPISVDGEIEALRTGIKFRGIFVRGGFEILLRAQEMYGSDPAIVDCVTELAGTYPRHKYELSEEDERQVIAASQASLRIKRVEALRHGRSGNCDIVDLSTASNSESHMSIYLFRKRPGRWRVFYESSYEY